MSVRYHIGVDGGGTGTRVRVLTASGQRAGRGEAGPSSLSHGVAGAWGQILAAATRAFDDAGIVVPPWSDCALAAGLAGANHPALAADFMAANPGFATLALDTDSFTALLGALDGRHGVTLIAGTGSVAEIWRPDGTRRIAGGWGFPVGDEGSGAWLGLQAVRLAQQALDGRAAGSPLTVAIHQHTGHDADAMLSWCGHARQTEFASLAPLVFDHAAEDLRAQALLDAAANELSALVDTLDPLGEWPVACSGTIARRLRSRLPAQLQARCVDPAGDAVHGALHLLRATLAGGLDGPFTTSSWEPS